MWIYLIFAIGGLYALLKERELLGCTSNPTDAWKQCDKYRNIPQPTSYDPEKLYATTSRTIDFVTTKVEWRSNLVTSLIACLVLWYVMFRRVPTEWELLTVTFVIYAILFMKDSFFKYHFYKPAGNILKEEAYILAHPGSSTLSNYYQ